MCVCVCESEKERESERECVCVRVCMRVCLSVCLSFANHISKEPNETMAMTFDTMTASVTRMHYVLTILTLTFIQGRTDLTRESNKYSIISETVQAMPTKLVLEIVRRKVYIIFSRSDDINLHSSSQLRLKFDIFVTYNCNISDNI